MPRKSAKKPSPRRPDLTTEPTVKPTVELPDIDPPFGMVAFGSKTANAGECTVNNCLVLDQHLSDGAFRAYIILFHSCPARNMWIGPERLAKIMDIPLEYAQALIKELQDCDLLYFDERGDGFPRKLNDVYDWDDVERARAWAMGYEIEDGKPWREPAGWASFESEEDEDNG